MSWPVYLIIYELFDGDVVYFCVLPSFNSIPSFKCKLSLHLEFGGFMCVTLWLVTASKVCVHFICLSYTFSLPFILLDLFILNEKFQFCKATCFVSLSPFSRLLFTLNISRYQANGRFLRQWKCVLFRWFYRNNWLVSMEFYGEWIALRQTVCVKASYTLFKCIHLSNGFGETHKIATYFLNK